MIEELHEFLSSEVCDAFKELGVTAELMDYEVKMENQETVIFSKTNSFISVSFFMGIAKISTIYAKAYTNQQKFEKIAQTQTEQLQLMEELQEYLE